MPVSNDASIPKQSTELLGVGIAVVGAISSIVLAFFSKTLINRTSVAATTAICLAPLGLGTIIATAILCCKTKEPVQQAGGKKEQSTQPTQGQQEIPPQVEAPLPNAQQEELLKKQQEDEAAQQAEQRKQAETARLAEIQRQQQEEVRLAEIQRQAAETATKNVKAFKEVVEPCSNKNKIDLERIVSETSSQQQKSLTLAQCMPYLTNVTYKITVNNTEQNYIKKEQLGPNNSKVSIRYPVVVLHVVVPPPAVPQQPPQPAPTTPIATGAYTFALDNSAQELVQKLVTAKLIEI